MNKWPILLAVSLFLSTAVSYAHPPESVALNMDSTGTVLSIETLHPVKNPDNHYIKQIEVKIDGTRVITQSFPMQLTDRVQEAVYKIIGLKSGAVIEVISYCNIAGKKTARYTVP